MEIENRQNARRIKLIFFALPFLFVLTVGPLLIFDVDAGFEIIVTFAVAIVILYLLMNVLGFNYLKIKIDKKSVVVKYFGLAPLNKEYKAFKIKSSEVVNYKIEKKLFGLKKMLILFRKDHGELYKYPPVNVNALNKTDFHQLIKAVGVLVKINH